MNIQPISDSKNESEEVTNQVKRSSESEDCNSAAGFSRARKRKSHPDALHDRARSPRRVRLDLGTADLSQSEGDTVDVPSNTNGVPNVIVTSATGNWEFVTPIVDLNEMGSNCELSTDLVRSFSQIQSSNSQSVNISSELASRVLFYTVDWLRRFDVMKQLPSWAQWDLATVSWSDLFVLGLCQVVSEAKKLKSGGTADTTESVKANAAGEAGASELIKITPNSSTSNLETARSKPLVLCTSTSSAVTEFVDQLIGQFVKASISAQEYTYLRCMVLLGSGHLCLNLRDTKLARQVAHLESRVLSEFAEFLSTQSTKLENPVPAIKSIVERGLVLTQLLSTLRYLDPKDLEEAFFSNMLGSVSVSQILPYLMKSDVTLVSDSLLLAKQLTQSASEPETPSQAHAAEYSPQPTPDVSKSSTEPSTIILKQESIQIDEVAEPDAEPLESEWDSSAIKAATISENDEHEEISSPQSSANESVEKDSMKGAQSSSTIIESSSPLSEQQSSNKEELMEE